MNEMAKICVIRKDRLGDLLMTLPCLVYLRDLFPNAEIDLSCQEAFHDLLNGFCLKNRIGLVTTYQKKYDAALFLNGSLKEYWEIFKRRIPLRVGLYSKLQSFLFLNSGIRQKRSQTEKNEAEFNLELAGLLANGLGINKPYFKTEVILPVNESSRAHSKQVLSTMGINENSPFAVFHPGMRGSALNVSTKGYLQLIEAMEAKGLQIVLSIGPEQKDQALKIKILKLRPNLAVISALNLPELAECFRMAEWVVAPSTGPLHLAHWVGVSTLGLYSPVRSQHPIRWAPWGGQKKPKILLPKVECPAQRECLGASCKFFNCMDTADWKDLLLQAENG